MSLLTGAESLFVNIAAWVGIHLSVSLLTSKMDSRQVCRFNWMWNEKTVEKSGRLYERLMIKKWKDRMPEAGGLFPGGFSKKHLHAAKDMERFVLETKRGELSHWMQLIVFVLFFIWNTPAAGLINGLYAACFNLPFIMIQRYNRIRLNRALSKRKTKKVHTPEAKVKPPSLSSDKIGL
ncbi:hypothetical protein ACTSEZ_03255 [Metabacillus sp. JX24]|uniref:glycosyl-4,4'-diaponeurosporenoate acyltransferase CrtO family protein n=1 Tax=Metabacillus sp. JX24 TaxID=3240759 RepID=UPI00350FA58C